MALEKSERIIISIPEYNGAGIYKITNLVNGKVYIGSSKHIRDRLKSHDKSFRNGYCNAKFMHDILGGHKFIAEVIEKLPGITRYELRNKEEHYSTVYNSFQDGYNTAPVSTYDPRYFKDNEKVTKWLFEKM